MEDYGTRAYADNSENISKTNGKIVEVQKSTKETYLQVFLGFLDFSLRTNGFFI